MSHDYFEPKLRVAASGMGGSGYRIPTRQDDKGKPLLVPGVTTVLGALDKGGIVQWAVDNTAAYAVANIDALLNRTEEAGYGFLRWYWRRMKESDFDNPDVDIRDASNGVLNDLAELGTMTHDWIADFVLDNFPEDLVRPEQEQMAAEFVDWFNNHDVQPVLVEKTVVGDGYAGTLDHLWIVDGVATLIDAKTSRHTRDSHIAQIAALGAANYMMTEVTADHPDAVEYETKKWGKTYWIEEPIPAFSEYAILHLRPDDYDAKGNFVPAFCELKKIPHEEVEAAFDIFQGALQVKNAESRLKRLRKEKLADDE